jgi:hypothetical protein
MTTQPDKALAGALEYVTAIADITDGTTAELARRFSLIHDITTQLQMLAESLTEDIAARMEEDQMVVAGVGQLVRKRRMSSAWLDDEARERMHDDAISEIIKRVAVDPMTGEIHPPLANATREAWRLINESFSIGADPKAGFRKVLGLAPDMYRTKYATGFTVAIEQETV